MTVQPKHDRFDPATVVLDGLRAALPESDISLGRDATYEPEDLVSVVQVPVFRAAGSLPGNRWLFNVTVTISTSGPEWSVVADEADRVGDAMLSLTEVSGVIVSSVRCVSEPTRLAPHSPSGAEIVAATYSCHMRRKEPSNG